MASIDSANFVNYENLSVSVKIVKLDDGSVQVPKVYIPNFIVIDICNKFALHYDISKQYEALLFSIPDLVIDLDCTAACIPSIWMQLAGSTVTVSGDFEFAIHCSNKKFSYTNWYIAATCKKSTILL